jgi:hypothetical protein
MTAFEKLLAALAELPNPDTTILTVNERSLCRLALAIIEPMERARDVLEALEYACQIDGNTRRGAFVKAFVEGEAWAEQDLAAWRAARDEEDPGARPGQAQEKEEANR